MPLVDFSRDRLVVIFIGTRSTSGYSAQVRDVVCGGGSTAYVMVDELYPGPKQKVSKEITSPWVMIAVDRAYLDINAKVQKVEDNRLPSISINPLTTFTPLPWDSCGYGIGGAWVDPFGYGFDNLNDFQGWCQRNQCDYPLSYTGIDFSVNQLVFVSGGDFGLGFGIQIGDVFVNAGETVIQVQRTDVRLQPTQRSYLLLSLPRQSRRYAVEYLVSGNECFAGQGRILPIRQPGTWVFRSTKEWENVATLNAGIASPDAIDNFDYQSKSLGVVYLPEQPATVSVSIDRVAYRGTTAYVYLKKAFGSALINGNVPYFLLKLDKKIQNIKVVGL